MNSAAGVAGERAGRSREFLFGGVAHRFEARQDGLDLTARLGRKFGSIARAV